MFYNFAQSINLNHFLVSAEGSNTSVIEPYIIVRPFLEKILHHFHMAHDFIPFFYGVFITVIIGIVSYLATKNLKIVPGPLQNLMELIYIKLEGYVNDMMGEEGKNWFFLIAPLFIYILISNLLGVVPQGDSPTANINQTIALALYAFFFTHYTGFKTQGLNYIKHFFGEVWWLAPLFFVIHIIGELARPLSLAMRLFGNIRGEDITLCILIFLFPLFLPIPMIFLMVFTSLIQAMVFTMLTMVYISGALPHKKEH